MTHTRRGLASIAVGLIAILAFALAPYQAAAQSGEVVIFAAASLKNALDDISAQWQKDTGKKAAISYAASAALAKQIEAAAPADLYVSADLDWMDYLQQRSLIKAGTRSNLLGNRIVLIAAKDSKITTTIVPGFNLAGLLGSGRLAMADVAAVPAGKYGKASLEALGVGASVQDKIAQAENVRATLLLVSRGEAPLGIVYQTDAAADPNVRIVGAFPENTHPPIIYPVALTASSKNPDAVSFLAYVKSAKAKPLFEKQGFTVLMPPGRV
jgi:molybdate transport system substrate-binding protein